MEHFKPAPESPQDQRAKTIQGWAAALEDKPVLNKEDTFEAAALDPETLPTTADGEPFVPWHRQKLEDTVADDPFAVDELHKLLREKGLGVVKFTHPDSNKELYSHIDPQYSDEELDDFRRDNGGLTPGEKAKKDLDDNIEGILETRSERDGIEYRRQGGRFIPGTSGLSDEVLEANDVVRQRGRDGEFAISPRGTTHTTHEDGDPNTYKPRPNTQFWDYLVKPAFAKAFKRKKSKH